MDGRNGSSTTGLKVDYVNMKKCGWYLQVLLIRNLTLYIYPALCEMQLVSLIFQNAFQHSQFSFNNYLQFPRIYPHERVGPVFV
jgi:hypothetical protein